MLKRWRLFSTLPALLAALFSLSLQAGEVINDIKSRDQLRCGVSEGIPGFSEQDATGRWHGFDVDFCHAVAAALLGDAGKVQFVSLKASSRFPALKAKQIDLLVRDTTWTLTREVLLQVQFPAVMFYDGQAFMVPAAAGISRLEQLQEARICVAKGTTHESNLVDYARLHNLHWQPLVIESTQALADALFAGQCDAYSADAAHLTALQLHAPGGAAAFPILPERITREPLGPVVLEGDEQWTSLVRWVLYSLVIAEEYGVTQANAEERIRSYGGTAALILGGQDTRIARALGARDDWAIQAIRAVGNYGEMYDRNLGSASPYRIERGLNRLWNAGGLMYAPPLD